MSFVTRYIANYQVRKLAAVARKKEFIKIAQAKSVGILFDATNAEDFEVVKKFIQQLKEYTKGIHAIGFFDSKHSPNYQYIKTDVDLFGRKELKKLFQPQSPYIKTFIETERDILIDANIGDKLPLRYIAAASKAKCKVGVHTEGNELFHDVLLNLGERKDLSYFLQQALKYLT